MTFEIRCSCCGHRSRKFSLENFWKTDPAEQIAKHGWDSFGDAFYCPKCVKTWASRNGKNKKLWGEDHTKQRVYQVIIGDLLDHIEYMRTGEWPM